MRKNTFLPADHIAVLNNYKQALLLKGNAFTKVEMLEIFRNCGIPANNNFWSAFASSGLIKRINKSQYSFVNEDPIHVNWLVRIYNEYRKIRKGFPSNQRGAKRAPVKEVVTPVKKELTAEEAIKFLKEKGYRVLEPVGVLYKVL